jgi:hypothetical protein
MHEDGWLAKSKSGITNRLQERSETSEDDMYSNHFTQFVNIFGVGLSRFRVALTQAASIS